MSLWSVCWALPATTGVAVLCRLRSEGSNHRMRHGAITSRCGSCSHQGPRCQVASAMRKRLTGSRRSVLGIEDFERSGWTCEPVVDAREHPPACRLWSPRARDRTSCQLGKLDVRETMCRACDVVLRTCLLYTSPSPRDRQKSRMP